MPSPAFPEWIRREWPNGGAFREVKDLLQGLHLHTVCQSAQCPNHAECWSRRTATLMVLGNICTRHCRFCAVNPGRPDPVDPEEPEHVAEAVRRLNLAHVVITTVTRDDLPDGGADHIARCVETVRAGHPAATVEVLVQDFEGKQAHIQRVLEARPHVFGHNIETVARLHPILRDRRFQYSQSLDVLRIAAVFPGDHYVKSGFMLGCGETEDEIHETLCDLRSAGCSVVSIGQYLQPTPRHHSVERYISPDEFKRYEALAYSLGFRFAVAGPFVRSSYRAEEVFSANALKQPVRSLETS